jgi:cytidylate kinase
MSQGEKMLISITGFIGSGKDTVANYLTTNHGFKKESWAGSLKDAVSNVFGWDRELLEGTTKYSREWREEIDPWWSERLVSLI